MTPNEKCVVEMRLAALTGTYGGLLQTPEDQRYIDSCRRGDFRRGVLMIFTRDVGHHSSGWWKNPDFERCWHLSVSFFDPMTRQPAPFNEKEARRWARLFFGDATRWLWVEPPYSPEGRARGVHHYRLFANEHWRPIKPRGEVYSKANTPPGWKSFSEIHGDMAFGFVTPMGYEA